MRSMAAAKSTRFAKSSRSGKSNADGAVTRKKARIAASGIVSNGKIPDTFSANLAGETSRYMTQIELQNEGARTVHKDVGGGLTSTGINPTSENQAAGS